MTLSAKDVTGNLTDVYAMRDKLGLSRKASVSAYSFQLCSSDKSIYIGKECEICIHGYLTRTQVVLLV
jgi:hypothetical protein